jgi:hypothetical protein
MSAEADARAALHQGIRAYAEGDYRTALAAWEPLFQASDGDESRRTFLSALIHIAGALERLRGTDSVTGSLKLLERAEMKLASLSEEALGLHITRLREGVRRCRDAVAVLVAEGRRDLDPSLVPPIEAHRSTLN